MVAFKKHPTFGQIENLKSKWDTAVKPSVARATEAITFLYGSGQKEFLEAALKDTKEHFSSNYVFKIAEKDKAELCDFSLSLQVSSKDSGTNPRSTNIVKAIVGGE